MRRSLLLPVPPTANQLYIRTRNGFKGARSKQYKAWADEFTWLHKAKYKKPLGIKYCFIHVLAHMDWRKDLPNIDKAICDLLQDVGELIDDRYVVEVHKRRVVSIAKEHVLVSWGEADNPEDKP